MRKSTYIRFFITMALIVFISFSLLGGLSIVLNYRRAMTERREMMTSALRETARYVTTQHLTHNTPLSELDISIPFTMISRITGFDVLLTDKDGIVTARSEYAFIDLNMNSPNLRYYLVPSDVLQTLNSYNSVVMMSTLGDIYPARRQVVGMPLAVSIGGEMRPYGYLFITSDMAISRQQERSFSTAFILLALSVMLLSFIISFITSKKQAEPLIDMAGAARRFARGELDARVDDLPNRNDEIGQLAEAFNFMAASMQNNEQLRRDFIANLSHELKTPMTVISGFAEGLLDGTIPANDAPRYLQIISSETKRLSRLVKSMTDISTLGEETPEIINDSRFDISEVIRLTLLGLTGKIESKELDVEAQLPEEPIITRGNVDSITQVVYNLIDNAIKYSYRKSVIKVDLWQQEHRVFVSVTNSGDTIPPEELPHIFQRFHKIDKSRSIDREGIGLGLYIVKTILDRHNEDIFVTSTDGITRFIFSLTVVEQ